MKNNKDYVWAIFLIFIGSIFLLNTTGVLPWNVWLSILNFWPVFLILAGLRLILGRSLVSTIILAVVALIAFIWIGISVYVGSNNIEIPFFKNAFQYTSQNIETVSNTFTVDTTDYEDVQLLSYKFNLGISEFTITDGSDNFLYLDASYTEQYGEPRIDEDVYQDSLTITMQEQRISHFPFINFKTPTYDFVLGSNLASDLSIDNGVGKGRVELETQKLRNLSLNTGTGDLNITLGLESIPTEKLTMDVGTGDITLNLPAEVGYELTYDLGVGEIKLDDKKISGIGHDGSKLQSSNYDSADVILNITADVGVGNLDINLNN
jgi:hypothetical protein